MAPLIQWTEDAMVGWHHQLNGHVSEWTPGVVDGQGGLACCGPWGCKEWDAAEHAHTQFVSSNPQLLIYPALLSPLVTMFVFYV